MAVGLGMFWQERGRWVGLHGWISLLLPTPTHLLQPAGGETHHQSVCGSVYLCVCVCANWLCVWVCVCVREWKRLFVCSGEQMAERRSKWEMCYIGFMVTACAWTASTLAAAGLLWMGGRREILDFTWLTHYMTICFSDSVFGPVTHRQAACTQQHINVHTSTHMSTRIRTHTIKLSGGMCVCIRCSTVAFNP